MEPELNPTPEFLQTPSSTKKPNVILLSLVILIIILGVISWMTVIFQPKQATQNVVVSLDEMKDWKTYRNDEYGFEVKYPEDWELSMSQPNNVLPIKIIKNGSRQKETSLEFIDGVSLIISVSDSSNLDFANTDKKFSEYGFEGLLVLDNGGGTVNNEYLKASHVLPKGKFLNITWDRADFYKANDLTYQKYLLPILSTFKFTK